eukprot:2120840-Pyramimonas_sp.AAC.1
MWFRCVSCSNITDIDYGFDTYTAGFSGMARSEEEWGGRIEVVLPHSYGLPASTSSVRGRPASARYSAAPLKRC